MMISWELARPVDLSATPRWHARIADPHVVPPELTERLCDEFDFVCVRSAARWDSLRRSVAWEGSMPPDRVDFSRGRIVGLVARVGEPASGDWPIHLDAVRLVDRAGWVRFRFISGLYYPISSGAFLVAAYVPGLKEPQMVQINRRVFAIAPGGAAPEETGRSAAGGLRLENTAGGPNPPGD